MYWCLSKIIVKFQIVLLCVCMRVYGNNSTIKTNQTMSAKKKLKEQLVQ